MLDLFCSVCTFSHTRCIVVELLRRHVTLTYVNDFGFSLSHSTSDVLLGPMVLRSIHPATCASRQ